MGWDAELKLFATAPLKEYPPRLNETLAKVLLSSLSSEPCPEPLELGDHFRDFVSSTRHLQCMLDTCKDSKMRPDWFQG